MSNNSFDLESGLRLIVFRVSTAPHLLNVVADVAPHTLLWDYHAYLRCDAAQFDCGLDHLKRMVPGQFRELHPVSMKYIGLSEGVPHFFGDLYEMDRTESRILSLQLREI